MAGISGGGSDKTKIIREKENDWKIISYVAHREVLTYICAEIQKEFPERYKSSDDVFKEFIKAHFTGQLLLISSLVEKTFGEVSFRILGNMTPEQESAVLYMETFRKLRLKKLKSDRI